MASEHAYVCVCESVRVYNELCENLFRIYLDKCAKKAIACQTVINAMIYIGKPICGMYVCVCLSI